MSTHINHSEHSIDNNEIVQKASQLLRRLPSAINQSEKTQEEYRREFRRLYAKIQNKTPEEFWGAICDTRSKCTYYRRLAAVKDGLRHLVEDALSQHKYLAMDYAIKLYEIVEKNQGVCPLKDPKQRHSKRSDMRGLPSEWRMQLLDHMKNSTYLMPYLVMALTGCRPEELEKGVRISKSEGTIRFDIQGAKVKETQGQPDRVITYSTDDDYALVKAFVNSNFVYPGVIKVGKKENYTSAIKKFCRKIWPKKKLTPICIRHAAASDYKNYLSSDDGSKGLGHAVDATKSRYGQRQMSKGGGLKPVAVSATREIRHTAKNGKHFSNGKSSRP